MPTLRTVTLGCRVNQYETEYVRQGLELAGFQDAAEGEPADVCIVNTCTVTHEGDAKSRQAVRKLAKQNPAARIVVMGCYATRAPDEVAALPGVAEVITDKRELPDLLGRFGVAEAPTGIARFESRRRAYVKVQDGCMLSCTFCIMPTVRPHLRSRPVEHIEEEVTRLAAGGHREIVLTGIHLGHYGIERNQGRPKHEWLRLSGLLERLMRLDDEFRVRLSSIEATEVTRELIGVMAAHPRRICPHLHVSMQSGSESVLRRMRRRWGIRRFVDRCRLVGEALDRPALSTDVIVGFPGETEAEFTETLDVCREVGFSKIHVFPFSARRGTPAADMPGQVPPEVKRERVGRLNRLGEALRDRYYESLRGTPLDVLVEGDVLAQGEIGRERRRPQRREQAVAGTACRYATVEIRASRHGVRLPRRSEMVTVTAGTVRDGRILATLD